MEVIYLHFQINEKKRVRMWYPESRQLRKTTYLYLFHNHVTYYLFVYPAIAWKIYSLKLYSSEKKCSAIDFLYFHLWV